MAESSYTPVIRSIIDTAKGLPGHIGELKNIQRMIDKEVHTVDEDYTNMLLFPEFNSPARVPTRFPLPSSVFQIRQHGFIVPDADGSFGMIVLPKVFGYAPASSGPQGPQGLNWAQTGTFVDLGNVYLFTQNYQDTNGSIPVAVGGNNVPLYYQSARLTACAVKLTYVGAYESTSGFLAGGLNYSYVQGTESTSNVEDSYYLQRAFTGDGLRVLGLPRDQNDLEYTNFNTNQYGDMSEAIMIYGNALPGGNSKIRYDIYFCYEGLPALSMRDYIDTRKADSSDSTMKLVTEIHNKAAPFFASLSSKDAGKMYGILGDKMSALDQIMNGLTLQGNQLYSTVSGQPIMNTFSTGQPPTTEELEAFKRHITDGS